MARKIYPLLALLILLLSFQPLGAQVPRVRDFRTLNDTLSARLLRRTTVDYHVAVTRVRVKGDKLDLTFNNNLSYYPWHEADVAWFRQQLEKEWRWKDYTPGRILTNRYNLEDLVTPILGASGQPSGYALGGEDPRETEARFIEQVGARRWLKGLNDRYIVLWQSHGRYYDESQDLWTWQRAAVHRTVEDMYTQTYVLPFLIPMLENAGAYVMTPRERDTQVREIITDNDPSFAGPREGLMRRAGRYHEQGDWRDAGEGFADAKPVYTFSDHPFRAGTARVTRCAGTTATATASWTPDIQQRGRYAVYVSYKTLPNSTRDARYTVYHLGGQTEFSVNQKRGGGTWIYLGTFDFAEGTNGRVVLDNRGGSGYVVTADAVKIGGGIGKLERGGKTSGMAASAEGAHYWMQWAGADSTLTRAWETDYTCDYSARGAWTTMMREEKDIPIDLALAFHSDAGVTPNDSIVGTLAIYTLRNDGDRKFADGRDRVISRVLCDYVQTQIVQDLRSDFDPKWTRRGLWDRSYSEPRTAGVPAMILELLSHQNFADMRYGLDPAFRFTVCRAVYKGILKTLSEYYRTPYVVQPLPPKAFAARLVANDRVQLDWEPTPDPKEPTAESEGYIVYTRIDDGAFDGGVECGSSTLTLDIEPGHIYSYKVVAINSGGKSFPSEILSVGIPRNSQKAPVLIVNNFDRISAPAWVDTPDYAGFEGRIDAGVPYLSEIGYVGENYEFRRQVEFADNDYPGFGASFDDQAGQIVAGNSFDYPYVHGKTLLRLGYPFYSMSRDAFVTNDTPAFVVDLICGKQARTTTGTGPQQERFVVFPKPLTDALRTAVEQGSNLLVSGANIASDNDAEAAAFAAEILGYKLANPYGTHTGCIADMPFSAHPNADIYSVERPDGIKPAADSTRTWLRYPGSPYAAALWHQGANHKAISLGVPIEAIVKEADREWIFRQALNFLYNEKEPELR
ncbi:MAG: xanthan lyase [Bacteroidales bacterium]|nr:xanthan lyase [Bacteroidales bacterium]